MRDVLVDADAFRFLRGLGLLDAVFDALSRESKIWIGEYVARHELNLLFEVLEVHRAAGRIDFVAVAARTSAFQKFRAWQKEGFDKGEAEAIAWASEVPHERRPLFVTRDSKARQLAQREGVLHTDVMGIVVEAVCRGHLELDRAREALSAWDDPRQQQGKPHPYAGFDEEWKQRVAERTQWA